MTNALPGGRPKASADPHQNPGTGRIPLIILALLLPAAIGTALLFGRYPLTWGDLIGYLGATGGFGSLSPDSHELLHNLIWEIRLPRVATAVLVGASLAASGAAYQAVFANPLVSPGILGVLAGASFGAALGMISTNDWTLVQAMAVAGGLLAVAVGVAIGRLFGVRSLVMLVLGGIFSGALFSGLLALIKYSADPYQQLPAIIYWLMGSLGQASLPELLRYAPLLLGGILGLSLLGRALDALAMGEEAAASLGIPVSTLRGTVIALATLISALTVALAGMIGWIGLLAPHIARLLVGPLNRYLVPASALLGGIFLLAADGIARALTESELPVGVVTELVGLPVFLLVLRNVRRGWAS